MVNKKITRKMESTKPYKSIVLAHLRLEKFNKKVTWSDELTDVKVMTPQSSMFDNFAEIVFLEEEEESFIEDEGPPKFVQSNICDKSRTDLSDSLSTSKENIQCKNCERILQTLQCYQSCHCYKTFDYVAQCQNMETITQTSFEEEKRNLDQSLQKFQD